jgi:hypothetical protein
MTDAVAAYSNPLARATWKVPKDYHTAPSGGIRQQVRFTFEGGADAFTVTAKALQEFTNKYVDDPQVRRFTRRLFNGREGLPALQNFDHLGEINSLVQYFQGTHTAKTPADELGSPLLPGDRGSYRYQMDPYGVELFQSPPNVLNDIEAGESGADCDDIAACAAACLVAAGYPAMLMIVDAGLPGQYNHVMLATKTPEPNQQFGTDFFPVELIHPLGLGKSVPVHSYIPLMIQPYDMSSKTKRLIPSQFR